ncbi:MAG: chitobiase/beta-hexosaminidase C-terminal domain-containing protein [Patescibacteria group bacterium]
MPKFSKFFFILPITFFLFPFVIFAKIGQGIYIAPNVLENSGFEEWGENEPNNWKIIDMGGGSITKEDTIKHSGNYSAKLYKNTDTKVLAQKITGLNAGDVYQLSFWARYSRLGIIVSEKYFLESNNKFWDFTDEKWVENFSETKSIKSYSLNDYFSQYSLNFTVPESGNVTIEFAEFAETIGTTYLDDIYLNQVIEDPTPPATVATKSGKYSAPKIIILSASDNEGGSGVDKIYYTLDGSTPSDSSSVYISPIKITKNTILKFFAVDKAGNRESVKTKKYYINQIKFVTKKSKDKEVLLKKGKISLYNFNFSFLKFPKKLQKQKKSLSIKIKNKYTSKYPKAKIQSLKKYWRIKTNLNNPNKKQFKLKLTFKYNSKELKVLKKKNKAVKENILVLKYYNPQTKTWNNLPAKHNKNKNTFIINFYTFLFSDIYFTIGIK